MGEEMASLRVEAALLEYIIFRQAERRVLIREDIAQR